MSFTLGAHLPGTAVVASDCRWSMGDGVHFDLGGKMLPVPCGWAAATTAGNALPATLRQLGNLCGASGPDDYGRSLQEGYEGDVEPDLGKIFAAGGAVEGVTLRSYHLDGSVQDVPVGAVVHSTPGSGGDSVEEVAEEASRRALGQSIEGPFDLLRSVGSVFAAVAETADNVSPQVQVGIIAKHSHGGYRRIFLAADAGELKAMESEEIKAAVTVETFDPAGVSSWQPANQSIPKRRE